LLTIVPRASRGVNATNNIEAKKDQENTGAMMTYTGTQRPVAPTDYFAINIR